MQRELRTTFSALGVRNYRLYFTGLIVATTGRWMQMIAQAWLVLELSDDNAAVLGLVTAMQWLPILLIGPWAGVLADRVDKRRLLIATQSATAALGIGLGVAVLADVASLGLVMGFAAALGLVTAADMPARQSFLLEMVGSDRLTNAVSLNTVTMNIGRLVGPAIAGLVISYWDLAICFLANGLSFGATIVALMMMRTDELETAPPVARAKGQLREGLRIVWSTPGLRTPLLMMLAIGLLTYENQITLPVLARETFQTGADGFGLLQSAMSVGAVVGGLVFATRTQPSHRRLTTAAAGLGAVTLALAFAPTFATALVVLPLMGVGSVMFLTMANSTLQLTADPAMRSRVMALYTVAFVGSTPIGGPIVGWVAQVFGVRWAIALGGITALFAGLVAWRSLRTQPDVPELVAARMEREAGAVDDTPRSSDPDEAAVGSTSGPNPGTRRDDRTTSGGDDLAVRPASSPA
ncbi:MFS transporter [Rhabdothermincola salaria]|uniref:MFS transporter n=1 Tax=Rhabdothermincola salaria TaxID=2903142 RepID=UPI001E36EEA9|nr:MFS transporter [Rhabdothermincola salaria]